MMGYKIYHRGHGGKADLIWLLFWSSVTSAVKAFILTGANSLYW